MSLSPSSLLRLETDRLVVRLATPDDVEAILAYYRENAGHLAPYEPARPPDFYTTGFWKRQVRRSADDWRRDIAVRLFVFERADPRTVAGYISLTGITRGAAHFAFLGYSLAHARQGRGLMTEALQRVIDYAFHDLRLRRVMANYMPWNRRSARVLDRLGFRVEGYARQYLKINGHWEDHVMTSLVDPRAEAQEEGASQAR